MNCQKFEEVVDDIAREQLMSVGVREEALAHTRECVQCGRRLADELCLTSRLRGLAAAVGPIDASETLPAGLLEAFDRLPSPARRRFVRVSRGSWVAIAAALLLVIGVLGGMMVRWRRSTPVTADAETLGVTDREAPPEKEPDSSPYRSVVRPNTPPRVAGLHVRRLTRRPNLNDSTTSVETVSHHSHEIATDFFRINYSAVNLAEGGRVIRVSLPRSAMARFGLPVNMDRANEPVKADVILGIDNLPQAIRFVQEMASADVPGSKQRPAPSPADARKPRKEKKS